MAPIQPVVPLLCVGCGSTLSYTDQIMCTKRRWGFGDGAPENACFMNSLVKGAFVVGDSYGARNSNLRVYCCRTYLPHASHRFLLPSPHAGTRSTSRKA